MESFQVSGGFRGLLALLNIVSSILRIRVSTEQKFETLILENKV